MTLPGRVTEYKSKEYWNNRFHNEDSYEWLGSFDSFATEICSLLQPNFSILVLGCGSSSLSFELYERGYQHVISIDFSDVAIENMKRRYAAFPELKWEVVDVRHLLSVFEDHLFDAVIDKGTFESLIVDEGDPWCPSETAKEDVHLMLSGIERVLRPQGFYFHVSFMQPFFRARYLRRFSSEEKENPYSLELVSVRNIPVGLGYYLYIMSKMV
jgi:SAM-dependent methyltransferase